MMTDITTTITNTIKEKLTKVRQLINAGWCQGHYVRVNGEIKEHCLAGAIYKAHGGNIDASIEVHNYVRAKLNVGSLAVWNDADGRTKEEVLAFLDEVIRAN